MPEKVFSFECGCSFPVLEEAPEEGMLPLLDLRIYEVPLTCPAVWRLFAEGRTIGVFQVEKKLGQEWSRKLRPESIEHIAALLSLLRPGCLNSRDEHGVSMTENYCLRKNGEAPVEDLNPALVEILGETYNVLIFQEQIMKLAGRLAGFDLAGEDRIRKGVGKKLVDLLASLKNEFLEGCRKVGVVPDEQARLVWSWIEAAGRYSFNLAHALTYGLITYFTAYAKVHMPLAFYTSWLACTHLTKSKQREQIAILVEDAKLNGITIAPPDARNPQPHFYTDRRQVYFGLGDVKKVGGAKVTALQNATAQAEAVLGKPARDMTWFQFLRFVLSEVSSDVATNLIAVGSCDWAGKPRARLRAEYDAWDALTKTERDWVNLVVATQEDGRPPANIERNIELLETALKGLTEKENSSQLTEGELEEKEDSVATLKEERQRLFHLRTGTQTIESVEDALEAVSRPSYRKPKSKKEPEPAGPFGGCSSQSREAVVQGILHTLRHPPSPLVDSPRRIVLDEEELLGVALTADRLDQCDLVEANTSISEVIAGKSGRILLGVEVMRVKPTTTKKGKKPGQKMAQLTLRDRTASVDAVIFPEEYQKFGPLFQPQALLLVHVEPDRRSRSVSVIVKAAWRPR